MEISKKAPWRIKLTREGKVSYIKLLGGGSQKDEVVAFDVDLQKGDLIEVVSSARTVGFNQLEFDHADSSEQNGAICIGKPAHYDVHLSTQTLGGETISFFETTGDSLEKAKIQKENLSKISRKKTKETVLTVLHNLFIAILVFAWLIPIFWLILVSFSGNLHGASISSFFPEVWSIENYQNLFFKINDINRFPTWFKNTLIVSVCSTIISTLFILATAFSFSRFRFKKRKGLMNISMIIALFPGMLTMVVSYNLFQYVFKIDSGLVRLIIAYSAGAGLGYLVAKGFFDTIPTEIDEAAKLDGASASLVFFKILLPLSKPIIVYIIITSFMAPWVDFVFAKIILGNSALPPDYTVAMGLVNLVTAGNQTDWFGVFAAGSVLVALPLSLLFIFVQKYYVSGVTGGAVKG